MILQKSYLVASCLLPVLVAPLFAQNAYVRTTTNAAPWVDSGARAGTTWATTTSYIEIFPDSQYQTIQGFGGTFQEKGWNALSHLSAAGRDSVIRALFDTSGCNFNWGRVPVGLCDFDDNHAPYSLDDSSGDYQMKAFSLARDSLKRIPLIKMAQAYKPNMRFFASPWSPPGWMKTSNSYVGGNMKTDTLTLAAYALYLGKTVKAYQAKGINIESITCQNEPNENAGGYPQCGWTNAQELTFYHNYLIPRFKQDSVTARIILGVYCCGNYSDWITYFMNDSVVANFVNATSHSFQQPSWGTQAWAAYPRIPFYETESNYGSNSQTWSTGVTQFNDLANFMSAGRTSVFTEWNIINNQTCSSGWGWGQYVMIIVDTARGGVTYSPYFYAAKHFGHYVQVGAKAVKFTVNGISNLTSAAFRNPNGDIIFVTSSASASASPITVKVVNEMYKVTLPANSFTTLKIVNAAGVQMQMQSMKLENSAAAALSALSNVRIRNSTLYFSLSAAVNAREADLTLTDLQGRTVCSGGRRVGSTLRGGQQDFAIRPVHDNLRSGTYLLTARIRNDAGAVTIVKKVTAMN